MNFLKNIVEIEILLLLFIFKDIVHEIIQEFCGIDIFWGWIFNKDNLYQVCLFDISMKINVGVLGQIWR